MTFPLLISPLVKEVAEVAAEAEVAAVVEEHRAAAVAAAAAALTSNGTVSRNVKQRVGDTAAVVVAVVQAVTAGLGELAGLVVVEVAEVARSRS